MRYDTVTLRVMQGSGADQWNRLQYVNSPFSPTGSTPLYSTGQVLHGSERQRAERAAPGEAPQQISYVRYCNWLGSRRRQCQWCLVGGRYRMVHQAFLNGEWTGHPVPEGIRTYTIDHFSITASMMARSGSVLIMAAAAERHYLKLFSRS